MRAGLLDEVKRLSVEERIELTEAIWETIPADVGTDALPLSDAHRREIDRRLADLEARPDDGAPWPEVRDRLARRE